MMRFMLATQPQQSDEAMTSADFDSVANVVEFDGVRNRVFGGQAIAALALDIKISHSVFALPFAVLAAFLAQPLPRQWGRFGTQLGLVILCMILARTAAMIANRILDRDIDAANPRTHKRAIASGRVALRDAIIVGLCSSIGFVVVCMIFGFAFDNWWPFLLSIPVLLWICAYPLLKRVSWLCHIYLGASLAISPLAAAIAIEPTAISSSPALWLISAMVLSWVAGFDIIYALQDIAVDQQASLNSIPSRFGYGQALWMSRGLHVVSLSCLIAIPFVEPSLYSWWFSSAIGLVALLLIVEHIVTHRDGTGKIQLTFFMLNGIISCILGLAGVLSILNHAG